jgi:AraC-like DNA-binding protein
MVNYEKYLDIEIFEGKILKHQYPWHFHNSYTIVLVEKGSILYEFQENLIQIEEGEVLFIEPLKVHRNTISTPTIYKAIFVPNNYFDCLGQSNIATEKLSQNKIFENIVELFSTIKNKKSKREVCDSIFRINEFMQNSQKQNSNNSISVNKNIPHINLDLSINELSKEAHLSKYHYQRKFKKKSGLTIGQLKQHDKTTQAKMLLENGQLSTDVAYQLGFFDQSHFIKYFKKMWVISPKFFKKAHLFTIFWF